VAAYLPLPLAPVVPISTVTIPSPLYAALRGYKDAPVREARRRCAQMLAALLETFLAVHRSCLETLAGGMLGLRTAVPPTRRPGPPPLGALVRGLHPGVLVRGAAILGHGRSAPCGFAVPPSTRFLVQGRRALLLDDTFTTGARAQSAAAALLAAGAVGVVIVVVGRVLRPDRNPRHAAYWRRAVAEEYRLDRCCLPGCSGDRASAHGARPVSA